MPVTTKINIYYWLGTWVIIENIKIEQSYYNKKIRNWSWAGYLSESTD